MTSAAPRLKLNSTADLVVAVRYAIGFTPRRSVVMVCLRGERLRMGLVTRFDLPDPDDVPAFVAELGWRAAHENPAAIALLVFDDHRPVDGLPHRGLADRLIADLDQRLLNVALVVDDTWWSYLCTRSCCPAEGTRIDPSSPGAVAVAAAHTMAGTAVLADRSDLVRSVAFAGDATARAAAARLVRAAQRRQRQHCEPDRRAAVVELVRRLGIDTLDPRHEITVVDAAELAAFCLEIQVRDALLVRVCKARHRHALRRVLAQAVRLVPPPYDAPLCATFAWVAYSVGDGATANVAVERALRSDPDYSLAHLILAGLDRQVPPQQLVIAARSAAAVLKRRDLAG